MAAYAWAKSRSLIARLWPPSQKPILENKSPIDGSLDGLANRSSSNERYFSAIKDGGIWLS